LSFRCVLSNLLSYCPGCAAAGEPLLNSVNPVPDSFFAASSEQSTDWKTPLARLDGGGYGWCADWAAVEATPPTFFIQASARATSTL